MRSVVSRHFKRHHGEWVWTHRSEDGRVHPGSFVAVDEAVWGVRDSEAVVSGVIISGVIVSGMIASGVMASGVTVSVVMVSGKTMPGVMR